MWGMNKHPDIDRLPVLVQLVVNNLSHLDLPEINRRTEVERTEPVGPQQEMTTR